MKSNSFFSVVLVIVIILTSATFSNAGQKEPLYSKSEVKKWVATELIQDEFDNIKREDWLTINEMEIVADKADVDMDDKKYHAYIITFKATTTKYNRTKIWYGVMSLTVWARGVEKNVYRTYKPKLFHRVDDTMKVWSKEM